MSLLDKKVKEKEVAEFFSNWLNDQLKYDFEATADPEDQNIDYVLKSKSDSSKNKYLQLINCDRQTINVMLETFKSPNTMFDYNLTLDQNIGNAIQQKNKKYPKEVQKSLTLIVWSNNFLTPRINEDYLKRQTNDICNQTDFKDIFYIALPDNEEKNSALKNNGQIIPLK